MNIVLGLPDISDAYESKICLKVVWSQISLLHENKYLDVHVEVEIKIVYDIFNRPPTKMSWVICFGVCFISARCSTIKQSCNFSLLYTFYFIYFKTRF